SPAARPRTSSTCRTPWSGESHEAYQAEQREDIAGSYRREALAIRRMAPAIPYWARRHCRYFSLQNVAELDRPSVERYQGTKMALRSNKRPAAFPCAKVESALREWWNQYTSSTLTRRRS